MQCVETVPLLLIVLIALLIALLVWGLFRSRVRASSNSLMSGRDDMFMGLLVLAAFASGSFLTFILLSFAK